MKLENIANFLTDIHWEDTEGDVENKVSSVRVITLCMFSFQSNTVKSYGTQNTILSTRVSMLNTAYSSVITVVFMISWTHCSNSAGHISHTG